MGTLIVNHRGRLRGAVINGRVLIGRWRDSGIAIGHPDVSRLHAWIDTDGETLYIADADSRGGTTINGEKVVDRHHLAEGDVIGIGPARLEFHVSDELPPDMPVVLISEHGIRPDAATAGILFMCDCDAPLWVHEKFAGLPGKCKYCGRKVVIPEYSLAIQPTMPAVVGHGASKSQSAVERLVAEHTEPSTLRATAEAYQHTSARLSDSDVEPSSNGHRKKRPAEPRIGESHSNGSRGDVSRGDDNSRGDDSRVAEVHIRDVPEPDAASQENSGQSEIAALIAAEQEEKKSGSNSGGNIIPRPRPATPLLARDSHHHHVRRMCSVCQCMIEQDDPTTVCSDCGLVFHTECWTENRGCSAYGCSQVNALETPTESVYASGHAAAGTAVHTHANPETLGEDEGGGVSEDPDARLPLEFLLLACAAVAAVVSALSFGAPSAIVLIVTLVHLARRRQRRFTGVVITAMALSVVGLALGIAASLFLYMNRRVW